MMTPAELAALPELPRPNLPSGRRSSTTSAYCFPRCLLILFRGAPLTTLCACTTNRGRAWEVVRLGDPPQRWKVRRPADDQPQYRDRLPTDG